MKRNKNPVGLRPCKRLINLQRYPPRQEVAQRRSPQRFCFAWFNSAALVMKDSNAALAEEDRPRGGGAFFACWLLWLGT